MPAHRSRFFWRLFSQLLLVLGMAVAGIWLWVGVGALLPGLVLLLLSLFIGYRVCHRLADRVEDMARTAHVIAQGGFDERITLAGSSTLAPLARAINDLARGSAQRVAEVTADRNRLAAIFAGMVEGVIDVDENQHIQHINEAAVQLLRINARSSLKRPLWQEIRIKSITSALDQAMQSRDVVKSQMRLTRDRDELVVNIYAASLSSSAGQPLGAVIVLNDITEVENLSRVRTDFVANASHELKTPITAIRGLAETVLSDEEMDYDSARSFVGRIHNQSLRLSRLVSDLMAISRLESRHREDDHAPVNFSLLLRQAAQAAESAREARKQSLILDLAEEELKFNADRQNLSQVLDNLIDNAIKYTPEGGEIRVSLKREANEAVLTVKDTGIGISDQYQERVFERFYRVDKVRSQSLGGTGLGLSIVKNIVEKHGGSIQLESRLGSGSTFTIRLPMR